MSAWIDLGLGILQEFREAALLGRSSNTIDVAAWLVIRAEQERVYQHEWYVTSPTRRGRLDATRKRRREDHAARLPCVCGAPIPLRQANGPVPKFCSEKCQVRASNRRMKARLRERRAQRLAELRANRAPCACGRPVTGGARAKWCSAECKNNASRAAWLARRKKAA